MHNIFDTKICITYRIKSSSGRLLGAMNFCPRVLNRKLFARPGTDPSSVFISPVTEQHPLSESNELHPFFHLHNLSLPPNVKVAIPLLRPVPCRQLAQLLNSLHGSFFVSAGFMDAEDILDLKIFLPRTSLHKKRRRITHETTACFHIFKQIDITQHY